MNLNKTLNILLVLLMVLAMQACGGGSSDPISVAANLDTDTESSDSASTNTDTPETGALIISITDAPGDFVTYIVEVLSISLSRDNGDRVETLPLTTRIDFNELTELSELLTTATIPTGTYDAVLLTMDYSNADINIQDENGNPVAATPIDTDGNALRQFNIEVQLTDDSVIQIAKGQAASISLDFDLDASNEINLDGSPTVTVDPILLATPELEADREHRVRGALSSTDLLTSEVTLQVRPIHHRRGNFGEFTFNVDENTQYEVDGTGYTGNDGLIALDNLALESPVIANGSVNEDSLLAEIVVAGSSVPWANSNVVKGVVIGRDGNNLLVRGARFENTDGISIFRGEGTIIVGSDTLVSSFGDDANALSIQSISVGSRITAFGALLDEQTIDATDPENSQIVLGLNQLRGTVINAQPLAVELTLLNGRRPALFDFSGTGVDTSMDADPDNYELLAGLLNTGILTAGDHIQVRGQIANFGAAPEDFLANTIVNIDTSSLGALFKAYWADGASAPFSAISDTSISVELTDARKYLKVQRLDETELAQDSVMTLIAPETDQGLYSVKVRNTREIHLYRSFADLVAELQRQLEIGNQLHYIAVKGDYNLETTEITMIRGDFVLNSQSRESQNDTQ